MPEALEVSMVASVAGTLDGGRLSRARPFRSPHHSASMPALVGGGLKLRPGEAEITHCLTAPEFRGRLEVARDHAFFSRAI